jgi:hypothetical protein
LVRVALAALGVGFSPVLLAIAAVGLAIGLLVGKLAGLSWNDVVTASQKAWDGIVQAAEGLWSKLGNIFGEGVGRIAAIIGTVAAGFLAWAAIRGVIGAITSGIVALAASFISLPALITAAALAGIAFFAVWAYNNWDSIKSAAASVWEAIKSGASTLWDGIKSLWNSGVSALSSAWDSVKSTASAVWNGISDTVSQVWKGVTNVITSGLNAISQSLQASGVQKLADAMNSASQAANSMGQAFNTAMDSLIAKVGDAITKMNALADAANQAAQAAQAAVQAASHIDTSGSSTDQTAQTSDTSAGYASGGVIRGPGTTTSDSVPIWASRGEFVTRASAVSHYGPGLFHALNRMSLPKFAMGGLVTALSHLIPPPPSLRFADGGMVPAAASSGMRPVNIHLDGHKFGMMAANDVAESLVRVATNAQVRSAGRRPSYFGRGR